MNKQDNCINFNLMNNLGRGLACITRGQFQGNENVSDLKEWETEEKKYDFNDILKKKQAYYGNTEAAHDFAVEEYSTLKMIDENKSILNFAKHDIDETAIMFIENRIVELQAMIKNE